MPLLLLALALAGGAPVTALHVTGPDYGVEVAIDRRPAGRLPLDPIAVPAGLHLVELLRRGQVVWSRVVFVEAGATVELAVALERTGQPSPTLGELRRGTPAPVEPPPRYRLGGRLAFEGAAAGDAWDLDLVQRWRLEADPEGPFSAAAEARAVGDLAGSGPELWRAVHRTDDDPILVEVLWLRARGEHIDARVGRQPLRGPMGRAILLDGARVGATSGPWALAGHGGRRRAVLTPEPADPWMGGVELALRRPAWSADVSALYHQGLHVDARARAQPGELELLVAGGALDLDPMYADGHARIDLGPATGLTEARARVRWRGARASPFDLSPIRTSVIALDVPAGWTAEGGLAARAGPVDVDLTGGIFDGAGDPSAARPDRWWIGLDGLLARRGWGSTASLQALRADIGPAPIATALTERLRADLGAWLAFDRVRLDAVGGVERLVLDGPAGRIHRLLPVGGMRGRVALTDAIEAFAAFDAAAAHPTLHPSGGPLLFGRAGIELR